MSPPKSSRRVAGLRILRRLPPAPGGFLTLTRLLVQNQYEDGSASPPYRFEMVQRRGMDSVALIPFFRRRSRVWIVVKAGFRPALHLRGSRPSPGEGAKERSITVEAVAGSLEPEDRSTARIDRRAIKELAEETGFRVRTRDLIPLGAGFFPSHGQCPEKIHLRAVEIDPAGQGEPRGDGSVNEAETWTLVVEANDLLRRCLVGEVEDPKIEIGVRRLLEKLKEV